jgi:hypothetical protein
MSEAKFVSRTEAFSNMLVALTPNTRIHTAKIETHNGWWYRYTVHRTCGIGIPENSCSLHRTLKGAQRAARRWKAREYTPTIVERS